MTEGVFRYIVHEDVEKRLAEGWVWVCDLGEWSALMWWCIGACKEGEVP